MEENNELYRQMVKEKNEANLKCIGKTIEQLHADEFDRIIEEAKDTVVPEQLHNKLSLMIKEENRKQKKRARNKPLIKLTKTCACLLAVIFVSGAILFTNVESFQARTFEFFFDEQLDYIDFRQTEIPYDINGIIPIDWNEFWYPNKLPDGFTLAEFTENEQMIYLIFKDKNQEMIYFSQYPADNLNLAIDNTDQNSERIKIACGIAFWTSREDGNFLRWDKEGTAFLLQAKLPREKMIEIAENITYSQK